METIMLIVIYFKNFTNNILDSAEFAACGNDGGATVSTTEAKSEAAATQAKEDATTAAPAANKDPLKFVWFSDGGEGDVMQSIIDDFTAETGIAIPVDVTANGLILNKGLMEKNEGRIDSSNPNPTYDEGLL